MVMKNLKKTIPIFVSLVAILLLFLFINYARETLAGQTRDMQFGWGSGYSYDDIYQLSVPSSYQGCFVKIYGTQYCYDTTDGSSGRDESLLVSVKGCLNRTECIISADPGEVMNVVFDETGNQYCDPSYYNSTMWDYEVKKYGYCGDGTCGTSADQIGTCVNGKIATEDCSSCPSDCGQCEQEQKSDGESCSSDSECLSGFCVHGICRYEMYYGDDGYCDRGSKFEYEEPCMFNDCQNTSECQAAEGKTCSDATNCPGMYCVQGYCRFEPIYCGDDYCDEINGETASSCPADCAEQKKPDGAACSIWTECEGGHCVHSVCRSSRTYCGDQACDSQDGETCSDCPADCRECATGPECGNGTCESGETCSNCAQDCGVCPETEETEPEEGEEEILDETKLPDLRVFIYGTVDVFPGTDKIGTLILENEGEGTAKNVKVKIYVDRENLLTITPTEIEVGDIAAGQEKNEAITISADGQMFGTAHLMIKVDGNFGTKVEFVRARVMPFLELKVPESIILQPQETKEFAASVTNQSNERILVKSLTLESSDTSVVSIDTGQTMEVKGQGEGIEPEESFSTESDNLLESLYPKPKIKAEGIGETMLYFRLNYGFPENTAKEGSTLVVPVEIKVADSLGGKKASVDFEVIPSAIMIERLEAREIKLKIENTGSEYIKNGSITIKEDSDKFDATEKAEFGFIAPGDERTATIDVMGNNVNLEGDFIDTLEFNGKYYTIDDREYYFSKNIQMTLVKERQGCDAGDQDCVQAMACLMELSNKMSCSLEVADVIPYFDKPVAAVLATSDFCEIKNRAASGDSIGAAISTIFTSADLADNGADAVPGAGNLVSVISDIVEGAADCTEGYVYDIVNEYCASGKGYTGCAEEIFNTFAEFTGQSDKTEATKRVMVIMVGSPVFVEMLDDANNELTPLEGISIYQKEDLKLVFIEDPDQLKNGYNLKLSSYSNGQYSIHVALIDSGTVIEKKVIGDQSINKDETVSYSLGTKSSSGSLEAIVINKKPGIYWVIYIAIGIGALLLVAAVILIVKKRKRKGF
ncbi:MAG: hypothetical protein COT24_00840 [Candidatus Kerfeldbacteria bacterium CG08_land_8_20_14_0_20_40_16]|uniref:CARDB domain-containing protein n=1 Tax=Candidatus Kerfeldbacteria bacterium CG08_land_8_20_14_0_20_40_16 TaxID=2014244 RepID=A0A2H0YWS2_9BACT|nr:MAG: hypothetical protein COT24_00840 [Candidatus Kerfeldbacteria bacterium CG08_land_8_20_14_0_20_40_16]